MIEFYIRGRASCVTGVRDVLRGILGGLLQPLSSFQCNAGTAQCCDAPHLTRVAAIRAQDRDAVLKQVILDSAVQSRMAGCSDVMATHAPRAWHIKVPNEVAGC